ncbi:MAG: hypothetical protein OEW75_06095 [Cyclobacteriaceae bacterium]|nr:hypothetical protein [Cyclobacteriaceae bacterium]
MGRILSIILVIIIAHPLCGQPDSLAKSRFVQIDNIHIVGNTKTKEQIILREMSVQKDDYVFFDDLNEQLVVDQQNIYNMRLFNSVEIKTLDMSFDRVAIVIQVDERWYLFPSPILDLVDRNFNDWWQNNNHDLSRIVYGLKMYQYNVRGRNETLRLSGQLGYTKNVGISYNMPYIDKSQKTGLVISYNYSENNNIAFQTVNHKREFLDKDFPIFSHSRAEIGINRRNSFFDYHNLEFSFNKNFADNSVVELNPDFFRGGNTSQKYFSLGYTYKRNKRDVVAYPLKGYYIEALVKKQGLKIFNDVDYSILFFSYSNYFDMGKGFYLANHSALYFNSADKISYNNYFGLGYGKYVVRGYELFLIEGDQFLLNKTSIRKRIFSTVNTISKMPLEQFKHFPFQIYLKGYFDAGYVRNFENYFQNELYSNKLIYGGGIGLDFVTAYDIVLRSEFSVNDTGKSGFYLELKKEF